MSCFMFQCFLTFCKLSNSFIKINPQIFDKLILKKSVQSLTNDPKLSAVKQPGINEAKDPSSVFSAWSFMASHFLRTEKIFANVKPSVC